MRKVLATALLILLASPVPGRPDVWSDIINWLTPNGTCWQDFIGAGRPVTAVHATLLPPYGTSILFVGKARPSNEGCSKLDNNDIVFTMPITPIGDPLPAAVHVELNCPALKIAGDTLFCAGHTLLSDGRVFFVGGQRPYDWGLPYAMTYSPLDNVWSNPSCEAELREDGRVEGDPDGEPDYWTAKWYSTTARLNTGEVLVVGGANHFVNETYENRNIYTYAAPTAPEPSPTPCPGPIPDPWTLNQKHLDVSPHLEAVQYPHVFLLPNTLTLNEKTYDAVMLADYGTPFLFDYDQTNPSSAHVDEVDDWRRPGSAFSVDASSGGSGVLLPIRLTETWGYHSGSVLIVGGLADPGVGFLTETASRFDPFLLPNDPWEDDDLGNSNGCDGIPPDDEPCVGPRHQVATVLLPDGRVLIVNGQQSENHTDGGKVGYYDPSQSHGSRVTRGSDDAVTRRGYHNIALLLPDGRVLVGGGEKKCNPACEEPKAGAQGGHGGHLPACGNEQNNFQYYSPSYLDGNPTRPAFMLADAYKAVHYSDAVPLTSVTGFSINQAVEAVLMGFGSMTHSTDQNQRYVQIAATFANVAHTSVNVTMPSDERVAPPGYYMLFMMNATTRVPSIAKIIKLSREAVASAHQGGEKRPKARAVVSRR